MRFDEIKRLKYFGRVSQRAPKSNSTSIDNEMIQTPPRESDDDSNSNDEYVIDEEVSIFTEKALLRIDQGPDLSFSSNYDSCLEKNAIFQETKNLMKFSVSNFCL